MTPVLWFWYIVATASGCSLAALLAIPVYVLWRAAIGWALSGAVGDGLQDGEAN